MKDYTVSFNVDDKEYLIMFNLNVIQDIQNKYGNFKIWGDLIDNQEPNIEALIYGFTQAMNEAIDIQNEEKGENKPFLTERQVGRIITKIGFKEASEKLKESVIEATKEDNPKNE